MARAAPRDRPPRAQGSDKKPRKARPTQGERAARREERKRQQRAHRAGLRAVRREQWNQAREWLWPAHTRDVGKGRAVAVLLLNIAPFPGLGTALYGRPGRGALQFVLTFLFLIGWLWAILDGLRIVQRAHGRPGP